MEVDTFVHLQGRSGPFKNKENKESKTKTVLILTINECENCEELF